MKFPSLKKTPKAGIPQNRVDGFLIPIQFKKRAVYRNHPLFRSTLLLVILAALMAGLGGYEWYMAKQLMKTRKLTETTILAETNRLQNQTLQLKDTRDRYKELDILQKQLRIPVTPIFDTIEKTIPNEISINGLEVRCLPLATTGGTQRIAEITMIVYFPQGITPTDEKYTGWTQTLFQSLEKKGLQGSKVQWGPQQELLIAKTKQRPGSKGWTRSLSFDVVLENTHKS